MTDNNSTTDSFSWDLENLLIPENLNNLFVQSQEDSVPTQSIQVDSVTLDVPVVQQQQQQQQVLVPLSENRTAIIDQISADINTSVNVKNTTTPPKQVLITNGETTVESLHQSETSSPTDSKSFAEKYHERRKKNNMASRKSREKRKVKNHTVILEIEELSSNNERLKTKVKTLEENLEKIKAELFSSLIAKKTG